MDSPIASSRTSLGGARPKASVLDEDGHLTVAKFPSRKDDYDVASWEHFCHVMARKAGINVADSDYSPWRLPYSSVAPFRQD